MSEKLRDAQAVRAAHFCELHTGPAFVIPNPWDVGSAKVLASLGFTALATTSSGFAFTLGRVDGQTTLSELERHVARIVEATGLAVTVDLQDGYGETPMEVAEAIHAVAAAGAVGASIEDWGYGGRYTLGQAIERLSAALDASRKLAFPFTLTARADNYIHGCPDLEDTLVRLRAYEAAGADVLYAPGLRTVEDVKTLTNELERPLNVIALPGLRFSELAAVGAKRISTGAALAWVAYEAAARMALQVRDEGDFESLRPVARKEWLAPSARPPLLS